MKAELFPHYMERDNSFNSTSILGLIYDTVNKYQTEDQSIKGEDSLLQLQSFFQLIFPYGGPYTV